MRAAGFFVPLKIIIVGEVSSTGATIEFNEPLEIYDSWDLYWAGLRSVDSEDDRIRGPISVPRDHVAVFPVVEEDESEPEILFA